MSTLMHTVEAELLVTCIIDEAILELLQVAFFVKKQALEPMSAGREPLRASGTPPDAAALGSRSQDVLNRTVCCPFP